MKELRKTKNAFFAIIPNFVTDNLTAIPLSLYLTMRRIVGTDFNRECYLSERTYMERLEIGKVALKKAIKTLKDKNLIYEVGKKVVETSGGPQRVTAYKLYDITDFNNKYYKGGAKTTPLYKIGGPKNDKRGVVLEHKEDLIKEERIIPIEEQARVKETIREISTKMKILKGG